MNSEDKLGRLPRKMTSKDDLGRRPQKVICMRKDDLAAKWEIKSQKEIEPFLTLWLFIDTILVVTNI